MTDSLTGNTPPEGSEHHEVLTALRQIIQAMDLHSRYLLRRHGITGPQLVLLREVQNAGSVTVSDLARATSLSQGTVTNILRRLERGGLVYRQRSESDRRRVYVDPTPECQTLLATAPSPFQEDFLRRFSDLPQWERSMIVSALQRLADIMQETSARTAQPRRRRKDNAVARDELHPPYDSGAN
jgi:DNA-binding MarR family transcriptional regulator